MNTEVLWGGGLWWGLLRTNAPIADHDQQVFDVDDTVAIEIAEQFCVQVALTNVGGFTNDEEHD